MKINIALLRADHAAREKRIPFSGSLDLSDLRLWGERPFPAPVTVEGQVVLRAGIFTVDYTAALTREGRCARCLEPVRSRQELTFSHTVIERDLEEEEEEYIPAPGGILDVKELATADILLSQDMLLYCSDVCAGICPKCGADRNRADCGCTLGQPDSRFAALREILKENKE